MQYITACAACKHKRKLIDGWKSACDAFPEGIPIDYYPHLDKLKEPCNNGIGFDLVDDEELAHGFFGKDLPRIKEELKGS